MHSSARIFLVAAALAVVPACQRDAPDSHTESAAPAAPTKLVKPHASPQRLQTLSPAGLTEAERRFGRGPTPDPSVVYQPEVVIIGGGARTVRGIHSNGLGCSIDANAPRASEIRVDGIAFVTGRCVGRVLALQRQGNQLALTLGPVELTEIIRDASFELEQPLDLDDTLTYEAPDWPGARVEIDPLLTYRTDSEAGLVPARYDAPTFSGRVDRENLHWVADAPSVGDLVSVNRAAIAVVPLLDERGIVFRGYAGLQLKAPHLRFVLQISGGKVVRCELIFSGAAGLTVGFEAGASSSGFTNANVIRDLPVDVTIPIGGPVPFSVQITQRYVLSTGFSAKNTFFKGFGEFTFDGALSMGHQGNKWDVSFPPGFSVKTHPAEQLNGVSLGFMALLMTHQVKILVGVGAFGFATGPYAVLNSSFTAARSPDTQGGKFGGPTLRGLAPCNQTTLAFSIGAGVGYMIPKKITDIINGVLETLNIKYRIKSSGGIESKPVSLPPWKGWAPKDVAVCKMT